MKNIAWFGLQFSAISDYENLSLEGFDLSDISERVINRDDD
jgi:hypothetical protein